MNRAAAIGYRPFELCSAVIPGQAAGLNPESISQQVMRPVGFPDAQLRI
jgi:hypothetical protein